MKIGVSVNPREPKTTRAVARATERAGLDLLGHPDSQPIDRELYASLALSADQTSTPSIAAIATNPVTRHVSVTASAIAIIDDIADGRAILGLATGFSAIKNTELEPASLNTLADAVSAIRELLQDGKTEWNDGTSRLNWAHRRIPIYIATTGPRTLEMAGKIADGVVYASPPNRIESAMERVASGAKRSNRSPADVKFWSNAPADVTDSFDEAVTNLRHILASKIETTAKRGMDHVPDELAERITGLAEEYRPDLHNTYDNPHNAELVDKYDLREYVKDIPIAGTPEDVIEGLRYQDSLGVDGVLLMPRHDHPRRTIERLGANVLPNL